MKKLILGIFILTFNLEAEEEVIRAPKPQPNCQEDEKDPATAEILQTFAGVVVNFGKVVADPNNPQNVAEKVANMVAGMINIASIMTKSPILKEHGIKQVLDSIDPKIIAELEKIAKAQAISLRESCIQ